MKAIDSIRKFEYRSCRIHTGFPVDFVTGNEILRGVCLDVSEAGVRAEFDGSLAVGNTGLIVLRHPTGVLKLESQVTYSESCQVGLVFVFENARERLMTTEFLAAVAAFQTPATVVPFP